MVTRTIEVNEERSATGRLLPFGQSLMAVLGICFVGMLVGLDQTIVGTALPTIVAELNGFELYAWVGTSYLLASVITVPICGRLSDYYGRKPFVVASVIIFTIASMLCGMAGSMTQLVLARALQGIGGGLCAGFVSGCQGAPALANSAEFFFRHRLGSRPFPGRFSDRILWMALGFLCESAGRPD